MDNKTKTTVAYKQIDGVCVHLAVVNTWTRSECDFVEKQESHGFWCGWLCLVRGDKAHILFDVWHINEIN